MHNNSAPEFITRLLDMGMDRFNFADALLGILAQRLAKKLCDCKESYLPSAQELKDFIKNMPKNCATQRPGRRTRAANRKTCSTSGQIVMRRADNLSFTAPQVATNAIKQVAKGALACMN